MIDGLLQVAVRHSKGLYFPEGYYRVGGWKTQTARLAIGIEEYNAAVLWPAIRFYAVSGYAPALTLAEELASFALHQTQGYLLNGAIAPVTAELEDPFHTRGNFMLGILKLGLVSGRPEYVARARQAFDQARRVGTKFGWFPEGFKHRHGEVCCMTDMIELALLLGKHVDLCRCRCSGPAPPHHRPIGGNHVDDSPKCPRADHLPGHHLGTEKDASQVDIQNLLPVIVITQRKFAIEGNACVVAEDIHPTKASQRGCQHFLHRRSGGDVNTQG